DDPATRRAAAPARARGGGRRGELGRADEAIAALDEAVARFRTLAAEAPSSGARLDLAEALVALAKETGELGRDDDAERAASEALETVSPVEGDAAGAARLAAHATALLAASRSRRADLDGADARYRAAIERLDALHAAAPDDENLTRELARVCTEYGLFLYRRAPERDELIVPSLDHLRRAVGLLSSLVERAPDDPKPVLLLCAARNNLSSALRRTGAVEEALEGYRANVEPLRTIAERFPATVRFRWELATAWNNIGVTLELVERGEEALDAFERSRELLAELTVRFPGQVEIRSNLGTLLNNLAVRRIREGDFRGAEELADAARAEAEEVVAVSPGNPQFVSLLRRARLLQAEVHAAFGRDDEALALLSAHRPENSTRWETCTEAIGAIASTLDAAARAGRTDVPSERYAALAADLGRTALDLGFPYAEEFRSMGFLRPLRETETFAAFLDEVDGGEDGGGEDDEEDREDGR
ncbi:MAG: hypothetical protein ACF8XB_09230, partial [Planctomycetota bacterium JB042]